MFATPMHAAAQQAARTLQARRHARRIADVVVVDPHPESYAHVSLGRGGRVRVLSNASAALRIPTDRPPLFSVVNTELPEMSGFDLRAMLIERWPAAPCYLISDAYDPECEVRARCSGATLYFCKPLERGWLAAAMRAALRQRSQAMEFAV